MSSKSATGSLRTQNMYLCNGPSGNELTIPGFADQEHGCHGAIDQKVDLNGNPALVFCLDDGRQYGARLQLIVV